MTVVKKKAKKITKAAPSAPTKKFELTNETKVNWLGKKLFRIKALVSIETHNVKPGDKGGWVENEESLEALVSGEAWVSGEAQVYGSARVSGSAQVSGEAWVYGEARVYGSALVYGSAWVYGSALVSGEAWVIINPLVLSGLEYTVTIYADYIQVGCKYHTIKEWEKMKADETTGRVSTNAAAFWKSIIAIAKIHSKQHAVALKAYEKNKKTVRPD